MNGLLQARSLSLHNRVGLVLTAVVSACLLGLGAWWIQNTRAAIQEEVAAATRVSQQWLRAVIVDIRAASTLDRDARLLEMARMVGRIRANSLEILTADNQRLYVSPPSVYKAGREAPAWFAALVTPSFQPAREVHGALTVVLRPDASRSVLDAWDNLVAMFGWALLLLAIVFLVVQRALRRALRPLDEVMAALDHAGKGRFDVRLPVFDPPELGRLSRAFNGMADRLAVAVDDNVKLETERAVDSRIQNWLEEERKAIARELHDELGQSITAVRALAGALAQRTSSDASLHSHAQSILAVSGEMQNDVSNILHRLRPPAAGLDVLLNRTLETWCSQYPEVTLSANIVLGNEALPDEVAICALRIVQEGLTNVIRHASASRVELTLMPQGDEFLIVLADDGHGAVPCGSAMPGSGLGLTGMRERVALIGGQLELNATPGSGFCIRAHLPLQRKLSARNA
jgi:two-component system, NarL family, sensor histidine kinase UhpB